ncbi:MAG TPA: hypothetical protein VKI17_00770 [Gemmataceae bacterium]|nr:hypothetical protein [Gemmataceae bacterium]
MPDPVVILKAAAAAAALAVGILLLCGWPWRAPHPVRTAAGGALAVGAGFFAGAWLLDLRFHFPPSEDQDRLLFVLAPAAVGVEIIAAALRRAAWMGWLLRLALAAVAARIILHNSSYITDLAGPGSREWPVGQTWIILLGLAGALAAIWALLSLLLARSSAWSVPATLALVAACAGVTIMLSGYASGGQLGFPLAAALGGAAVASLVLGRNPDLRGVLGVGMVTLFALLLAGRFFGKLTTVNAALLFAAPLLGWLPELPYVRRLGPRTRGSMRVVLAAVPLLLALILANQKSEADAASPSTPGSKETSIEDYLNFGK